MAAKPGYSPEKPLRLWSRCNSVENTWARRKTQSPLRLWSRCENVETTWPRRKTVAFTLSQRYHNMITMYWFTGTVRLLMLYDIIHTYVYWGDSRPISIHSNLLTVNGCMLRRDVLDLGRTSKIKCLVMMTYPVEGVTSFVDLNLCSWV